MLYLILLGLPGSGKGTQAHRLEKTLQYVRISTGDILRKIAREDTPLGRKVQSIMQEGKLVDDETVFEAVKQFMKKNQDKTNGFVLDGFPRNLAQAHLLLNEVQKASSHARLLALFLDVDKDVVLQRLTGRRVCPTCERVYHITFRPSSKGGVCEVCNTPLIQRKDDQKETIEKRLETYLDQTYPLIEFFDRRNLLRRIPADASEDQVYEKIITAIHDVEK